MVDLTYETRNGNEERATIGTESIMFSHKACHGLLAIETKPKTLKTFIEANVPSMDLK